MKRLNNNDLVIMDSLQQDSDEWLEWRSEGIGSSDIALLMSPKPVFDRTIGSLWRQKLKYERAVAINNEHVKRGKELEPEIRDHINEMFGTSFKPECVVRRDAPYLRASLDGLDLERDCILEIKAPSDAVFDKYLKTWTIPENYYLQMQYQMLVTDVEYGIFAFWNKQTDETGGLIHPLPYVMYVSNNHEKQLEIERRCALFQKGVETRTPVGWDGDELKLFHSNPIMFMVIGGQIPAPEHLPIPILTNPAPLRESSFIACLGVSGKDFTEWVDMNPEHEVKVINLEPSIFKSSVDELTDEGIIGIIKGML